VANKVGIITDSIACLTSGLVAQYGIRIVPYSFHINGRSYRDWVDVTPSEAYELFRKDPEGFLTSPASPVDYLEAYREVGRQTESIVCITLSSKLSTAYNVAMVAREEAEKEMPGTVIEVLDSQTATAAEGFIVLAAAKAAQENKNLAEVVTITKSMCRRTGLVALLDTVRHVYRSGRIPKVASQVGSALNIRPILTISSGEVHILGMRRNKRRGVNRLVETMRERVGQAPVHVAVMHAYALEDAQKLMERVFAEFNCVELWLTEFSPVMGYACGTGTLGLAFYAEE
jgi:DegV family protein with EDD domain